MSIWSDRLDAITAGTETGAPFLDTLILPKLVSWDPGKASLQWDIDPATHNYAGVVFGGQLALMADRAAALTAITVLEDHEHFTTSDLRTSFFRPVIEGSLRIEGRVVYRGRQIVQVEAEFIDDRGKLVAKAVATQHLIPRTINFEDDGNVEG